MRIVPAEAPMTREGIRDLVGGAAPMICMDRCSGVLPVSAMSHPGRER